MAPPAGTVPPTLPPSVEESYRRKCIQLKQRMNEVEEANDASRLRLVRMQRAIDKMRLERAFLLEQLAKRTSTNVEDSEGSPSPPPTPKEKPLRTKRGHRKPSFLTNLGDGRAGSTFIQQGPVTLSPSSDAFSHTHPDPNPNSNVQNPVPQSQPPKRQLPNTGNLSNNEEKQDEFQQRFERLKKGWEVEKEVGIGGGGARQAVFHGESRQPDGDEDVEMGDDGEEARSPEGGGGFTAVNQG